MANRESYPASLFPLRGDVSAEAGAVSVEVIGLQNKALGPLVDGGTPVFSASGNIINWVHSPNGALQINQTNAGDYLIAINTALTINYGSDNFLGVRINGVRDGG